MVRPTWAEIDLPVLEAIYEAESAPDHSNVEFGYIAAATGLDVATVARHMERLYVSGFIDGIDVSTMQERFALMRPVLLERGLRAVGAWPADEYYELVRVIEARISEETDEERRGNLVAFRDRLIDLGQGVATSVLSAYLRSVSGLP